MMIRIIAEGMYDTPHAVFEAHEIRKEKPDAVIMELPDDVFQPIFDQYNAGKLNHKQLKTMMLKAVKKEEKEVDHELAKRHLAGELAHEELEAIEAEGREVHVMTAAHEVKAELHAMDLPLKEAERYIERELEIEHIKRGTKVMDTKDLPFIVWELSEKLHWPYYFLERILHHHAIKTVNPFLHNVNTCPICRIGTKYDRIVNAVIIPFFSHIPVSRGLKNDLKVAYVLRRIDYYRERHMAGTISLVYKQLQQRLSREPKILVIAHLWNAVELKRLIKGIE
jgi:hypothetical protein